MAEIKIDKEVYENLEKLGINIEIALSEKSYVLNPIPFFLQTKDITVIEPYKIRRECLADFMQYCEQQVDSTKEKEKKKLAFTKSVLLDKNFSLILNHFMGSLYKNTRATLRENFNPKKIAKGARLSKIIKKKTGQKLLEDIILNELFAFLDSKPDKDVERNTTFARILKKYKPEIYEEAKNTTPPKLNNMKKVIERLLLHPVKVAREMKKINRIRKKLKTGEFLGDCYEFQLSRNPNDMRESALATHISCIKDSQKHFEEFAQDIGTLFFTAKKNKELKGYVRMFLMKSEKKEPILAIDTMEPPRKHFEKHIDLIKIMALAAIKLGLDLGVKYVLCHDARMKYGPREAYGNTKKSFKLNKIGSINVRSYCFSFEKEEYEPFVLMENWRR